MNEPMSDARLAEIRDLAANAFTYDDYHRITRAVPELLDEVERLRGVEKRLVQQHRDAYLIVMEERDQARNELRKCADLNRGLVNENADLRTQLAEIGETRKEFGVRTYDEDVEVMSSREQARDLAEAWRREIPGSNPTVMVRTRQNKPGEWREVEQESDRG